MEAWKGHNPVMPLGRGGCTIRSPIGEGGKVRNAVARDRVCPFTHSFGKTLGGNFRLAGWCGAGLKKSLRADAGRPWGPDTPEFVFPARGGSRRNPRKPSLIAGEAFFQGAIFTNNHPP